MKKRLSLIVLSSSLLLSGCGQFNRSHASCTTAVDEIDQFGNAVLKISVDDFKEMGFTFGDSVNVSFEGGYELKDTPFYNSFYGEHLDEIVTKFQDNIALSMISGSFADNSEIKEGEIVKITMAEAGKYSELMDLYYLPPSNERLEGQTDTQFGNMRNILCGNIKSGRLYRSASPFDPYYAREDIVSDYIAANGINSIFNLTDDKDDISEYGELTKVSEEMILNGRVFFCSFGADFSAEGAQNALAKIIRLIGTEDGPYLVHCSIGQDRTGFICVVLEGLCGANYDEIIDDYMLSYSNIYMFTKDSEPEKYELMKERVTYMLKLITGEDNPSSLTSTQLESKTKEYLKDIVGLSDADIDAAVNKLCR